MIKTMSIPGNSYEMYQMGMNGNDDYKWNV